MAKEELDIEMGGTDEKKRKNIAKYGNIHTHIKMDKDGE
jgi:hypothetical protein